MTSRRQSKGGPARVPVDVKTRARVLAEARKGLLSRNELARQFGISTSTVSRICSTAEPPHLFDRSRIIAATEAKTVDLKARRLALSEGITEDAERIRQKFWETQTVVMKRRGEDDTTEEVNMTARDLKDLATAFGILIDKHLVLVKHDTDDQELSAVDAWNAHVMGAPEETPEGWE